MKKNFLYSCLLDYGAVLSGRLLSALRRANPPFSGRCFEPFFDQPTDCTGFCP